MVIYLTLVSYGTWWSNSWVFLRCHSDEALLPEGQRCASWLVVFPHPPCSAPFLSPASFTYLTLQEQSWDSFSGEAEGRCKLGSEVTGLSRSLPMEKSEPQDGPLFSFMLSGRLR